MALLDLQGMQPPTPESGKGPPKRSGASKHCEGGGGGGGGNHSSLSVACLFGGLL